MALQRLYSGVGVVVVLLRLLLRAPGMAAFGRPAFLDMANRQFLPQPACDNSQFALVLLRKQHLCTLAACLAFPLPTDNNTLVTANYALPKDNRPRRHPYHKTHC